MNSHCVDGTGRADPAPAADETCGGPVASAAPRAAVPSASGAAAEAADPVAADPTAADPGAPAEVLAEAAALVAAVSGRERRVVLVTGAARRIGRAIALELAAQGWDVAVHHRASADDAATTARECAALGARAEAFAADLADEAACEALAPDVAHAFGRLDAVVHNASLFEHDTVETFGFAAMERAWRANTAPAVVFARALHRAGGGCLVNLLDQKLWNPNPDHLSYTLSKAALKEATTLLAQALAPTVRVCGVAPGVTLPSGDMTGSEFTAAHRMTPLGRSSTPEDVARAVRFVLESPAITGTTILVDGGQHLQPQARDVLFLTRAG